MINPLKPYYPRQLRLWVGVFVLVILLLLIYFVRAHSKHHKPDTARPVVTAQVTRANVPVYLSALGTVTPATTVIIRTQINGQLWKILFQEGQPVKAGEVLAEIDPRPFEAQVLQFEGALARDQASLTNAKLDLKRYQTLYKLKSVSAQTLDTQKSLVKQLEGTLKFDQGQLNNARLNLGYCKITSPIDGRVGLQKVNIGNFVQTSDINGIAVVNTLDPITVIFSLPEDDISQVAPQIYAGHSLAVNAYDRSQETLLATGAVSSIDNQIDPTTGTVKLKALFPNKDNKLFPDQFVNIKLLARTLSQAMLVPTAAIQEGVNGAFVYVVNNNHTVSAKPVVQGITEKDNTVIIHGLTVGESVVTEGADKLTEGAAISIASTASERPAA